MGYYKISQINHELIDEEKKLEQLKNAVICAILSPVGDQKQIILKKLYTDERS